MARDRSGRRVATSSTGSVVRLRRVHVVAAGALCEADYARQLGALAVRNGLAGWARTLEDGRVEAALEGPADAVDAAVAWCGHGPEGARVDGLDVAWEAVQLVEGFEVR